MLTTTASIAKLLITIYNLSIVREGKPTTRNLCVAYQKRRETFAIDKQNRRSTTRESSWNNNLGSF
jgi:hypothetical protein